MSSVMTLRCALSGPDPVAIATSLLAQLGPLGEPTKVSVDLEPMPADESWLAEYAPLMRNKLTAYFASGDQIFINKDPHIVKLRHAGFPCDPRKLAALLSRTPFELGSFMPLREEWAAAEPWRSYSAPSFADQHYKHGFACAFRGAGHARLVSRRWLDYGPWQTLRAEQDTTLVQFHSLSEDAAGALSQAAPGHKRMGISESGGFLASQYRIREGATATYSPSKRALITVVAGREVPPLEMRDAAAARQLQTLGPERPIDEVHFVFVSEELARRHLHELWLYGHRCFLADGTSERSLDADYVPPPPEPPAWAR